MVLKASKKKNKGPAQNSNIIKNKKRVDYSIVFVYLFVMLGIFPLYFKKQYEGIGSAKYELFWNASLIFLSVTAVWIIAEAVIQCSSQIQTGRFCGNKSKSKAEKYVVQTKTAQNRYQEIIETVRKKINLSFLDKAVLAYGFCVVISFLFSSHKEFALKGANGWNMGLYAQLIFVGLYLTVSRKGEMTKSILGIHMISSGLVFLFGILHRFEIDPLGMYAGLNLEQKTEFLSTLGQATWYSSYVCTTFVLGLAVFYLCEKPAVRGISGIYTILSFGTLVTQNSDSAFMALLGVFLVLGYYSLTELYRWLRFWQTSALMWGTFAGMGLLQRVFSDRAIPLDSLSIFFSQSILTWIMLGVSLAAYFYFQSQETKDIKKMMSQMKKIYQIFLFVLAAGIVFMILFIYLNTKGYLSEWFGYQTKHSYLFFDYLWGNGRGSSWMIAWQEFWQLPFLHKLFGVGPDCFSAYLYSIPERKEYLHNLWGGLTLTNAHNEYLNSLICYGIVGVTAWLTIIIGGIRYFYNKAKEQPFCIAFALSLAAYGCHNVFCYQQVCCTPFLFILLGLGECLTKSNHFFTIYPKVKKYRRKNNGR